MDPGQGQPLGVKAKVGSAVARTPPHVVDRLVYQPQSERHMLRQTQQRQGAAHRFAPWYEDLQAGGDRECDAFGHAERVEGLGFEPLEHLAIRPPAEESNEVGRSARKQC